MIKTNRAIHQGAYRVTHHLVKVCTAERRDYATLELARIGHYQTTIHYGLAYNWIRSLPHCP